MHDLILLDVNAFARTLAFFGDLGLVSDDETHETMALFEPTFPFSEAVRSAESIHLHIKVPDTDKLPHDTILARGVQATSCTEGYVKYPFPGGINMIFSSIPISEDDLLADQPTLSTPTLDHRGIDLRRVTPEARAVFDAVPAGATARGWRHRAQGGDGTPVYCCHTEVQQKHWVYPSRDEAAQTRPIEFAIGELVIHDTKMGCDLRPIDPAHPRAEDARAALAACAGAHVPIASNAEVAPGYYERADLARFAEVGNYAKPLMKKFWAYYNSVVAEDGALTHREKALIALAVAHSKQCPYCIDAYTNTLVDLGVSPDEMHEAVHVAAALGAGIDLVHGVQMQNTLRLRGAL
jgi:alkylhydroperoxidase/carboxymuconolactone decarboxylase family protein